ncbi:MAG: hypothetical protein J5789_01135 [Oscillospiraceae bacterium]|nr:hypothetical protein [Oscillospiraceae bacterium]
MNNSDLPASKAVPRKKGRRLRRVLCILVLLLALLAVLYLLFPGLVNLDPVVRFFRYMGLRDKETYGRITLDGGAGNVYAGFDDGLLMGSESGVTLYSLDGEQKVLIQGSLPTPVLRTGGDVCLVFSPGSAYAASVGAGGTVLMDGALSGDFINADVSTDGYTAYITTESGYKSVATVLNPKQEPLYRFSSRTRYLNACAVSDEGELLAVARLEEEGGVYHSGITILRTDLPLTDLEQDGAETARLELGNQVVYELRFLDPTHLMAVAQNEIVFLNAQGERLNALPRHAGELADYAVSSKGWVILALEQNGGGCRILTMDAEGNALGELDLPDRVRSVSAAGNYAAVLTETSVQTFDRQLSAYDRSWDVLSATRAIARSDGTVLLVGSGGTKLFIP